MAIINKNGKMISYVCSALIEELKEDIKEFGGDTIVAVWCKYVNDVKIYTNYDFVTEEDPIDKKIELKNDEFITVMSMSDLLPLLERQNSVI